MAASMKPPHRCNVPLETGTRQDLEKLPLIPTFTHCVIQIQTCPKVRTKNMKVQYLLYLPGPLNIAFIVPDVNACSLFTMNSWPSEDINFTYIASRPSLQRAGTSPPSPFFN